MLSASRHVDADQVGDFTSENTFVGAGVDERKIAD